MAYVARPSDFHGAVPVQAAILAPAAVPVPVARRRLWVRLLDAILESRERNAQRVVEQYVARRGKLTDSMEREIADRLTRNYF